jgi:protein CpxP
MIKHPSPRFLASVFLSAALLASPLALAGNHGDKHHGHHGKYNNAEMCEQMRNGTGKFSPENREARMQEYQAKMEQRHARMADRLKLTDEQREIWDEIHQEKQEKRAAKMEKWQAKMQEHCASQ